MAEAKHDEPIFSRGMLLIEELPGIFIVEDRFRLLERYAMLFLIGTSLLRIPLETYHTYIVCTFSPRSQCKFQVRRIGDGVLNAEFGAQYRACTFPCLADSMPDEMDASIIRTGVKVAPHWYFTQSIA